MTISGKGLAIVDWIIGTFPLVVAIGVGLFGDPISFGTVAILLWAAVFIYMGIRAWKSSNYPRRY